MPYVYPIHKLQQKRQVLKGTSENQGHEYAQPHVRPHAEVHDDAKMSSAANGNAKTHEYHPIDPTLKQPDGQYQELLSNGLPRGQSLPAISTFATLNS